MFNFFMNQKPRILNFLLIALVVLISNAEARTPKGEDALSQYLTQIVAGDDDVLIPLNPKDPEVPEYCEDVADFVDELSQQICTTEKELRSATNPENNKRCSLLFQRLKEAQDDRWQAQDALSECVQRCVDDDPFNPQYEPVCVECYELKQLFELAKEVERRVRNAYRTCNYYIHPVTKDSEEIQKLEKRLEEQKNELREYCLIPENQDCPACEDITNITRRVCNINN